jgi:hypothetical protein
MEPVIVSKDIKGASEVEGNLQQLGDWSRLEHI